MGFAAIIPATTCSILLLGMLLSMIVVSGVLSELSLRELTVVRRCRRARRSPALIWWRSRSSTISDAFPRTRSRSKICAPGSPQTNGALFLKISPRSAQVAAYRRTPARRGRDRHVGFRVATRFPFGLFEKSRELNAEGDLIIYPAVDAVVLPSNLPGDRVGGNSALGRGSGDEILSLRLMREGDDPRDIYWRKSVEQMIVRERAREVRRDVSYAIDSSHPGPAPDEDWTARFERRIRDVASRAVAHIKRGDGVTVRTRSGERVRATTAVGADPVLRFLALLEAKPAALSTLPSSDRAARTGFVNGEKA